MPRKEIKIDLVVHDLKSPLAVVQTGIESLLNFQDVYGALSAKQERILKRILRNTRGTQLMVEDILELGRSEEGKVCLKSLTLGDMVHQSLVELFDLVDTNESESIREQTDLVSMRSAAQQAGLDLEFSQNDWQRTLTMDLCKVKQILRNLLSNAFKFRRNRVTLCGVVEAGSLRLCVTDDGDGIPAAYHQKIFECYFQVDTEDIWIRRGHGLGLAGVMLLLEDLGGTLHLVSDTGQGAAFTVCLPLPDAGGA